MKIENITKLDANKEGIGYSWNWRNKNGEKREVEVWSGEPIELKGDICKEFKEKWGNGLQYMIDEGVIKIHEYDIC